MSKKLFSNIEVVNLSKNINIPMSSLKTLI